MFIYTEIEVDIFINQVEGCLNIKVLLPAYMYRRDKRQVSITRIIIIHRNNQISSDPVQPAVKPPYSRIFQGFC